MSSWHILINNSIRSFLDKEEKEKSVIFWRIYLGFDRGDHITIIFQPQENGNLKQRFYDHIADFLSTNPSASILVVYPLEGFFMNFPNNTIRVGKEIEHDFLKDDAARGFSEQISKAITLAFGEDEIDEDSIYAFLIYMTLGVFKSKCATTKTVYSKAKALNNFIRSNRSEEIEAIDKIDKSGNYEHILESNKSILQSIIQDLWRDKTENSNLIWLGNWVNYLKLTSANTDFNELFQITSRLICAHTGLNSTRLPQLFTKLIENSIAHPDNTTTV